MTDDRLGRYKLVRSNGWGMGAGSLLIMRDWMAFYPGYFIVDMEYEMEQNVVDAIKTFVAEHGGKSIKIQGTANQEAGTPDLIGGLWGMPFMCEVKQPGDPHPVSYLQMVRIAEWRKQNYVAFVAHSVAEFEWFMERARLGKEY